MASSKVKSDLARQPSTYSPSTPELQSKNFDSMSMDELIRHIYSDNPPTDITSNDDSSGFGGDGESKGGGGMFSSSRPKGVGNKTTEEVWKEIADANSSGDDKKKIEDGEGSEFAKISLEEFLTKTGTLKEEDVSIPTMVGPVRGFVVDSALDGGFEKNQGDGSILWLGNGVERRAGGRGKRRAVQELLDKVAVQKQRRLIKNRESAAKSRERKQAQTVELESLATQLEEENARLLQEQVEQTQKRYKQVGDRIMVRKGRGFCGNCCLLQ